MSKTFLDLKPIYNHRMVYPNGTKTNEENPIGITNIYIKESSFYFEKKILKDNVSCVFRRNDKKLDNIVCDNQVLDIDSISIKKISIIGFCSWGFFKEYFLLKFENDADYAKAHFGDLHYPLFEAAKNSIGLDKQLYLDGSKIIYKCETNEHKGYLYYYSTQFEKVRNLKQIIFPDNCLMNIFAITLED